MKCIILAGGPKKHASTHKQFMPYQGTRSLFQETIARNLPLCDEMNIIAADSSEGTVLAQMETFRDLTWRLTLEEEGRGTYPAILLSLWLYAPSELICIVPSDWAVSEGDYRGDVLKAMEAARSGKIAVVGEGLKRGILIFENGIFQRELRNLSGEDLKKSAEVFRKRKLTPNGAAYSREDLTDLKEGSVEKLVLSVSECVEEIASSFKIRTAAMLPQLNNGEPFVRMKPAFKDYLWGGVKLREKYGKRCDFPQIAESWELSAHPAGESVITTGVFRGLTFTQYLSRIGREAWGWKCAAFDNFPILVKFLDAKDDLSIQVHPDDDYALKNEGQYGKNEMWYVLECEEGARVAMGFAREVTEQEISEAIEEGTLDLMLNWVPVHQGDVIFIPSGTVHAVGKGCFILEIQQSSDITYRLYDYNRRDRYGNLRQLQADKAMQVMSMKDGRFLPPPEKAGDVLCSCKYFVTKKHKVEDTLIIKVTPESFVSLIFLSGKGEIRELKGEDDSGDTNDIYFRSIKSTSNAKDTNDTNNVSNANNSNSVNDRVNSENAKGPYRITYWPGDSVFLPAGEAEVLIQGPCEVVETRV